MPVDAELSFPAADLHQPTLELLKQTSPGRILSSICKQHSLTKAGQNHFLRFGNADPTRAVGPGPPGARVCAPGPARSPRSRASRPAAIGSFESPACAGAAGRARDRRRHRGRRALARTRRGPASARAPHGAGNREPAPAPSCRPASRGAGVARLGAREQHPGPPRIPGARVVAAQRDSLRQDPSPVRGRPTSAGPPEGTPPLA